MDTQTLKNAPAQVLNKDGNGVSQSLILQTENETKQQLSKNEAFQALERELTGIRFDEDAMRAQLEALNVTLTAQGLPVIEVDDTITTAKAKAAEEKTKELDKLSVAEMWTKIQGSTTYKENKKYFPSFIDAEKVMRNGKLVIYKGSQSIDKDNNKRYTETVVKRQTITGKTIEKVFFFALVDFTFLNFVSAVRYYSTFDDGMKSLNREAKETDANFWKAVEAVRSLRDSGMPLDDIFGKIKERI